MITIDVIGKEWWDKVNGNSYFSARIVIDYGIATALGYCIPFQCGYENQYEAAALDLLITWGFIRRGHVTLRGACDDQGIILRCVLHKKCNKKETTVWGMSWIGTGWE
jgi:hypothetical protein